MVNPEPTQEQPTAPVVTPQQPQARPTPTVQAPNTPDPPAAPAVPDDLPPPNPAQVTYTNGMLTVQAINSTLGGLLAAIRNKTGIQFEGLEGAANDRVAISMGPASEGEVLAAILGGSRFDYVVLDRADSPGTVQRVLLTPRGGTASTTAGGQSAAPRSPSTVDDDEAADEDAASDPPPPQDTPARPPLTQVQPQQPQPDQPSKTPEQLLEQLKQMQQQQQQPQQPAQNQAPLKTPPVPQQ